MTVLLFCLILVSGEVKSELICSHQPIVALAGDDVVLSCCLEPAVTADLMTVEWTKPGLHPKHVQIYQDGRLLYEVQKYYRTRLFVDELINGKVSLKLYKVKLSDEGQYRCLIPSQQKEASITLIVGK